MAQTDARAGFRLPWNSDRQSSDTADAENGDPQVAEASGWPGEEATATADVASVDGATAKMSEATAADMSEAPAAEMSEAPAADADTPPPAAPAAPEAPAPVTPPPAGKKPSKFMADLTKAMQVAAEDARSRAVTQLQTDAKLQVETIHGRSSTEAAGLRRKADDDVAMVREWSKAEIARIREETEAKITQRKAQLETEIEQHAGLIEREIDAVQKTVAEFEEEMASFFERLIAEQDPSRFATMAENLPEPPTFEGLSVAPTDEPATTDETVAEVTDGLDVADAATDTTDAAIGKADEATAETTTDVEAVTGDEADTTDATDVTAEPMSVGSAQSFEGGESMDGEIDREAAFAAIQAAAEAAASAEVAADAAARAEAVADVAIEIMGNHEDEEADPRFAALGISPDYDAAEAEALAAAGSSDEEIPEIGNDALAARLAGLVPGRAKSGSGETAATQVVVVGLVSVASIASFKRHLGRLTGVQSVGVSSGPDGEFIFAVSHSGDIVLKEAIPSLPSFQARVTGSSDGVVQVTAHDPEGDA